MSNIIKKSSSAADVRDFPLEEWTADANVQGQELLDGSRKEAGELIAQAQRKAEAIEREAYQRGFSQGEKAGLALGQQKNEPVRKALAQLLEEIASLRQSLLEKEEQFILRMGFLAACHIVHHEIDACDETVLDNVRAALHKVVRSAKVTLRVSPHEYKLVQSQLPDLLSRLAAHEDFAVESDAEVVRGGCFLSTESGDIDAQIDTQLAILRERLLEEK